MNNKPKKYRCEHCKLQVKTLPIKNEVIIGKKILDDEINQTSNLNKGKSLSMSIMLKIKTIYIYIYIFI